MTKKLVSTILCLYGEIVIASIIQTQVVTLIDGSQIANNANGNLTTKWITASIPNIA